MPHFLISVSYFYASPIRTAPVRPKIRQNEKSQKVQSGHVSMGLA